MYVINVQYVVISLQQCHCQRGVCVCVCVRGGWFVMLGIEEQVYYRVTASIKEAIGCKVSRSLKGEAII